MFAPPSSIVITGEKSREQFEREKQQRELNARLPKELCEVDGTSQLIQRIADISHLNEVEATYHFWERARAWEPNNRSAFYQQAPCNRRHLYAVDDLLCEILSSSIMVLPRDPRPCAVPRCTA